MIDPITLFAVVMMSLLLLIAFGVPVGIAMIAVGGTGLALQFGPDLALLNIQTLPYSTVSSYSFVVVPMFVLMGSLASGSGIVGDLYRAANAWLGAMRGGLYFATVAGSTLFAAVSGSTIVNSAIFTRVALPEMLALRYDRAFAAGCIAGVGTLAALIPPSLGFIVFGIVTNQSIGALLMAGILPGILTASLFCLVIWLRLRWQPNLAPLPNKALPIRSRLASLTGVWPVLVLVALVLGGIYSGTMAPSAAGAVGATGALILALVQRRLSRSAFWDALSSTVRLTSALFMIVIGGLLIARLLMLSGTVAAMNAALTAWAVDPIALLAAVAVLYFVLGMFIDPISMMVLTLPVVFPLTQSMGVDPIWFGVFVVKMVEIAVITPPVGMNLFAVVTASEGRASLADTVRGVLPFLAAEVVALGLLCAFPVIATILPETMAGR